MLGAHALCELRRVATKGTTRKFVTTGAPGRNVHNTTRIYRKNATSLLSWHSWQTPGGGIGDTVDIDGEDVDGDAEDGLHLQRGAQHTFVTAGAALDLEGFPKGVWHTPISYHAITA